MYDLYLRFTQKLYNILPKDYWRYLIAFGMGFMLALLLKSDSIIVNYSNNSKAVIDQDKPIVNNYSQLDTTNNIAYITPEKFITTLQTEVIKTLKNNDFSKFCKLFAENFAFEETAKLSLGKLWYAMDKKTQEQFLQLFTIYVSNSYFVSVGEIIRQADSIFVQNVNPLTHDSNIYTGRMVIVHHNDNNINVGFNLRKEANNQYKLLDFTAFRISFNLSIRRLFKPMLSHGIENIILNLKQEKEKILKHWETSIPLTQS